MSLPARLAAACRSWLDYLNGDAAYREYCRHWHTRHADGPGARPPSRQEFFRAEQERRWNGVRRCC
jgi:uncharacterized short protein YbdD (DUF466 family)